MIKLKTDLLIISILTAIVVVIWLVLGVILNLHNNQLSLQELEPLLKIPTYRIDKKLWNQLANYQPLDRNKLYDPELQPITTTKIKSSHSATSSSLLNQSTPSSHSAVTSNPAGAKNQFEEKNKSH